MKLKFLIVFVALCIIGIIAFILLLDDYVAKSNKKKKFQRKEK